jgi:hypothetical protein
MHPGLQQSAIVVCAISRAARGMLGPSGAVKICATGGVPGAGAGGAYSVAVCDGVGLMRELSVAHPAGTLLKEAVHGQQVSRPCFCSAALALARTRHAADGGALRAGGCWDGEHALTEPDRANARR